MADCRSKTLFYKFLKGGFFALIFAMKISQLFPSSHWRMYIYPNHCWINSKVKNLATPASAGLIQPEPQLC